MASSKRGAGTPSQSAKVLAQSTSDERPPKRRKSTLTSRTNEHTVGTKEDPGTFNPGASHLPRICEEEPLFPRGGGSVLSPLEQKHIQVQAKVDALFDTAPGGTHTLAERSTRKKKQRSVPKDGANVAGPTSDEDAVKIESLNFKVGRAALLVLYPCAG